MWHLLNTLARPSLTRHLHDAMNGLQQEASALLSEPPDAATRQRLQEVLALIDAAGWLLEAPLRGARRPRAAKAARRRWAAGPARAPASLLAGLRRHAGSRGDVRTLERLAQGLARLQQDERATVRWRRERQALEAMHPGAPATHSPEPADPAEEPVLQAALACHYGRTRRTLVRRPFCGKASRRLGRLVRLEELLGVFAGPTGNAAGQRRLLLEAVQESRALRRLLEAPAVLESTKDRRRLHHLVARRRAELAARVGELMEQAFATSPESYAGELPWQVFLGLTRREPSG